MRVIGILCPGGQPQALRMRQEDAGCSSKWAWPNAGVAVDEVESRRLRRRPPTGVRSDLDQPLMETFWVWANQDAG